MCRGDLPGVDVRHGRHRIDQGGRNDDRTYRVCRHDSYGHAARQHITGGDAVRFEIGSGERFGPAVVPDDPVDPVAGGGFSRRTSYRFVKAPRAMKTTFSSSSPRVSAINADAAGKPAPEVAVAASPQSTVPEWARHAGAGHSPHVPHRPERLRGRRNREAHAHVRRRCREAAPLPKS